MPFRRLRVRQFYVRLVCALLAGLLPMVLGLAVITWQTATGVRQDAVERLQHARLMTAPWTTPSWQHRPLQAV